MAEYLPGETLRITIVGKVGRIVDGTPWPEIRLDVEDREGGVTLPIPLGWPNVEIRRVAPAAGMPKPGELWTNKLGARLFVTQDRYGNVQFVTPNSGPFSIADMADSYGPLTPIYQLPEREPEPGWTWDDDEDNPTTCTDPTGAVWDLTLPYRDDRGNVWRWAGGFSRNGANGPWEPMWSRDDFSRADVLISEIPGSLTPVSQGASGAGA